MKVTFLGVGSAFSRKHGNSNVLIETGNMKLLIDCSLVCSASLREYGLSWQDITHIFITHLHADHITGLEEIAFMTRLVYHTRPVLMSTPSLLSRLWNHSLRGGLEYIELQPGEEMPQTLRDFFELHPVAPGKWITVGDGPDLRMYLQRTNHVQGMESYGLEIEDPARGRQSRLLFSGDTKFDPVRLTRRGKVCPLIFHDCQLFDAGEQNQHGVHASYRQLQQLRPDIRRRIWLYHYGDNELPDAVQDGFAGFIHRLQSFTL